MEYYDQIAIWKLLATVIFNNSFKKVGENKGMAKIWGEGVQCPAHAKPYSIANRLLP